MSVGLIRTAMDYTLEFEFARVLCYCVSEKFSSVFCSVYTRSDDFSDVFVTRSNTLVFQCNKNAYVLSLSRTVSQL